MSFCYARSDTDQYLVEQEISLMSREGEYIYPHGGDWP
jgi:hypothetical protein